MEIIERGIKYLFDNMYMSIPKICVLMSTYNGEKFLKQQLESILKQQDVITEIYVRDDGSKDSTVDILKEFSAKYSNITYYIGEKHLGPCGSFFELMNIEHDTDYYALSDQDDIWDKDKMSRAVEILKSLPQDKPALYHSNLRIVDKDENFIRISHTYPKVSGADYSCFVDSCITGCTAVYNSNLAQIASDIKPKNFSMHDKWIYIVASVLGNVKYDFEPHINYRQHGDNVIGASRRRFNVESLKRELSKYFNWNSQPIFHDAQIIKDQFGDLLNKDTNQKIDKIINYKDNFNAMLQLMFDKDFDSENIYKRFRFKVKVMLRNI